MGSRASQLRNRQQVQDNSLSASANLNNLDRSDLKSQCQGLSNNNDVDMTNNNSFVDNGDATDNVARLKEAMLTNGRQLDREQLDGNKQQANGNSSNPKTSTLQRRQSHIQSLAQRIRRSSSLRAPKLKGLIPSFISGKQKASPTVDNNDISEVEQQTSAKEDDATSKPDQTKPQEDVAQPNESVKAVSQEENKTESATQDKPEEPSQAAESAPNKQPVTVEDSLPLAAEDESELVKRVDTVVDSNSEQKPKEEGASNPEESPDQAISEPQQPAQINEEVKQEIDQQSPVTEELKEPEQTAPVVEAPKDSAQVIEETQKPEEPTPVTEDPKEEGQAASLPEEAKPVVEVQPKELEQPVLGAEEPKESEQSAPAADVQPKESEQQAPQVGETPEQETPVAEEPKVSDSAPATDAQTDETPSQVAVEQPQEPAKAEEPSPDQGSESAAVESNNIESTQQGCPLAEAPKQDQSEAPAVECCKLSDKAEHPEAVGGEAQVNAVADQPTEAC